MSDLRDSLIKADRKRVAIGHFNVSDLAGLYSVAAAARGLSLPVLIGTSEGERTFIGVRQVASVVRIIRDEYNLPIFLNADHTHSLATAEKAARAGYDMIGFDRSTLSFEENVQQTAKAVEAIKSISCDLVVEGELGDIGSGSEIHTTLSPNTMVSTQPDEARQFAEATKVDVIAPSVGNMHGLLAAMVHGETKKRLNVQLIADIKVATGLPLTLHGGSGTDDDDFRRAVEAGMTVVHISTELRLAWRRGLEAALISEPDNVVPYNLFREARRQMEEVVTEKLKLFNRL